MSRHTIDGYAVLAPRFGSRGKDVIGVGFDTPAAYADACATTCQRVPARDALRANPQWRCVKARISVTYTAEELMRQDERHAAWRKSEEERSS